MKTVAIISEYNPFHSGHLYQIQRIREEFGEDTRIVAIMSGNYTQRGHIAFMDKSARAKMAVLSGVNLVLELPFPYSCASAELFAKAGVSIADRLGCVDILSFGSECGNLDLLKETAHKMQSEQFLSRMQSCENKNPTLGYAKLAHEVLSDTLTDRAAEILTPNNILALEYLKALKQINSDIEPHTVLREGTDYRSHEINEKVTHQSASAIREALFSGDLSSAEYIPEAARAVLLEEMRKKGAPCSEEKLSSAILSYFRLSSSKAPCSIQDAKGGLYNRLITKSYEAHDISSLAALTETKKFTNARIRRAIWYSFFGVTSSDVKSAPAFTRVLALDKKGQSILRTAKTTARIPVLTKPSEPLFSPEEMRAKTLSDGADAVFQLTKPAHANGNYALCTSPFFKA